MADLERASSAFDVLPYADAARRGCAPSAPLTAASRSPSATLFAADLRAWAEERIAEPFEWLLVHPADLAVYLSRHEDGLHAMDGAVEAAAQESQGEGAVEDLSLVSISEDANPIEVVNLTLYDAMKAGASDIHIESRAKEFAIKYRIDGVLSQVALLTGREHAEQIISRIKVMSDPRHRGDPRAPGRPLQGQQPRPRNRRAGVDPSEHLRRSVTRCCGSSTSRRSPTASSA